ncbi:MmgE/Prp family protein [Rhizocola hellebori]|uniref:MmgE/Prp family protein n=1 Tax=Rhizocola hellebori TaxID=1392758 RepID=A0A8J3VCB5_9ACTN|nr:MmgE/PrpD family protein [Rhizocola hellebori]GIH02394.1 MmgE/Prp family protein [Rhizocola hellebori]
MPPDSPALQVLARWAAGVTVLPPEVEQAARRHLLDGLGCLVLALRRNEVPSALTVARALGGPGEATLFGAPGRTGAAAAAFGNAVAVHALDFDDTHDGALVHPTAVVLPVALAVAEQTAAGAADLLAAYAIGLELACRLGLAAPHGFHGRGLHATSVCGAVAGAAVAARLEGLGAQGIGHAMGIAASGSGGLLEFLHTGSSVKQVHPGFAAHTAVVAARLAGAGMTGPAGALDGRSGLFAALAGRGPDPEALLGQLSERWEATRIELKPYPACRLSHSAIGAANALRGQADPADIETIEVDMHPDAEAIVCSPKPPATPYEAKFSVRWCIAAMLIDGELTIDTFDRPQRMDIASLLPRISHRVVDCAQPAAAAQSRLTARLRNGRMLIVTGQPGGQPVAKVAELSWQPTVPELVQAVQGSVR